MKNTGRSCLIILLTILAITIFLSQLQPFIVRAASAVDGTFGVRPVSHQCLGITQDASEGGFWPPIGDLEFSLWLFQFRYSVTENDKTGLRPLCFGQDLWFGE